MFIITSRPTQELSPVLRKWLVAPGVVYAGSIHDARQKGAKHDITQNCQINTYQELHVFFTPQDNNKYRSAAFSFSLSARRRKGGTALHTHPLRENSCPGTLAGTSFRLLNAGSTFYAYFIRLSVKRERCAIEYVIKYCVKKLQ